MAMIQTSNTAYDVVELLLKNKDEAINFIQTYLHNNSGVDFVVILITALRRFVIKKLNLPFDDAMAFVDEEMFTLYPEISFYLERTVYE